jgi:hypothetical protein
MTVAAAIEIRSGATPAPSQGKTLGAVQQTERADAASYGLLSSTVSAATSFRANWQSLLASLGSSMDNLSEADANQGTASSMPASEQTSEKPSAATLATGSLSRQVRGTEKGSVETGAGTKLSSGGAQTKALVAQPAAETAKQATTKTEGKNQAAEPETESARSLRPARSTNTTKAAVVSAERLPGLVPATTASLSQAAPVAVFVSLATNSMGERAQMVHTENSAGLLTHQPAAFTSASLSAQPPERNASGKIAAAVNAGAQQTAEDSETPANPGKASPVPSPSGSTGLTLDETVANKDATLATSQAPSQSPLPIQHSIQAQVASPSQTQITALNTNPAETLVTNQASSPSLVLNPSRTPSLAQNQEQGSTQSINQIVNATAAPMHGDNSIPLSTPAAAQSSSSAAQSQALSNPTSASNRKASTPEALRSAHRDSSVDSVQHASQQLAGHASVTAVDASTISRALAGAGGTVSLTGEPTGASSVTASRPDSREAFATLDTAGSPGATTWIHAGAQRAEAGYQDPVLGWVSVRADLSGGGVHAQLVPGSADAAQVLGSHLTGLNTYLAEHHTPVETLTLTSPEGGWSGLGSGRGAGEGMQQGAGQQSAQNADASSPSGPHPEAVVQSPAASAELPAFFGNMNGSTQTASMGGSHISVMA